MRSQASDRFCGELVVAITILLKLFRGGYWLPCEGNPHIFNFLLF